MLNTKVTRWGISWAKVLGGATEACRGDRLDLTCPAKSTYCKFVFTPGQPYCVPHSTVEDTCSVCWVNSSALEMGPVVFSDAEDQ